MFQRLVLVLLILLLFVRVLEVRCFVPACDDEPLLLFLSRTASKFGEENNLCSLKLLYDPPSARLSVKMQMNK